MLKHISLAKEEEGQIVYQEFYQGRINMVIGMVLLLALLAAAELFCFAFLILLFLVFQSTFKSRFL